MEKKYIKYDLTVKWFFICLTATFFIGCSSELAKTQSLDFGEIVTEIDSLAPDLQAEDSSSSYEFSIYSSVDSIINSAGHACDGKLFALADSLLQSAMTILEKGNEKYSIEDEQEYVQRQETIAAIYIGLFPSDFFDNLPENIASFIFQHQLTLSLDSLQLQPEDSLRLAHLNCQAGIPYNISLAWNERVQKALLALMKKRPELVGQWLSRANHYLPFMRKMFADSSLPTDLAYLPLIESGFNPKAYSCAHASGIWQFISSTGIRYGLRNNYWFDERRDPIKSTSAAISYLKKLYGDFGDWHLALAAYNCGENGMGRAIERDGTRDYWQLKLPSETMSYVAKYIAALMVAKNPVCFGFTPEPSDSFDYDTVHVSECLDMQTIARGLNIPLNDLKSINPHISRWCTPPDMANVTLYLPKGKASEYQPFYATLTDKDKVKWRLYRIKRGDNLQAIARKHGVPVGILKDINKLKTNRIIAGNYLYIPAPSSAPLSPVADIGTYSEEPANRSSAQPEKAANPETIKTKHRVRPGETLWEISSRYNVGVKELCRWNNIRHPGMVQAGEVLVVHKSEVSTRKTSAAGIQQTCDNISSSPVPAKHYVVQSGDNLYTLAKTLNTPVGSLIARNNLSKDNPIIHPGQKLLYGGTKNNGAGNTGASASCSRYIVCKGDNLYSIAKRFSVNVHSLYKLNNLTSSSKLSIGDAILIPASETAHSGKGGQRVIYYIVKKGDNLWSIARSHSVPVARLCAENHINLNKVLKPGESLVIVLSGDI
jgi:membrane-bound lytic murein transglycosylase D